MREVSSLKNQVEQKDEEEQRRTLEEACYNLKVITDEELINIWNQRK